jgi:hypothetical protein
MDALKENHLPAYPVGGDTPRSSRALASAGLIT